jgi:hypothetical protein
MDLDSFLVAVDVIVDEWWQAHDAVALQGPGRPATLSMSEVRTLAVAITFPRSYSERAAVRHVIHHRLWAGV